MTVGLVAGAGCSLGCPAEELLELLERALGNLEGRLVALATIDRRAEEPCMVAAARRRGVPLRAHPVDQLAAVEVPTPSETVHHHVGTASVAEAAALLAAGPGARLVVSKLRSPHATCAVAREAA